eukprot:813662-Amorphochlora_amoeboformis.AAC.1
MAAAAPAAAIVVRAIPAAMVFLGSLACNIQKFVLRGREKALESVGKRGREVSYLTPLTLPLTLTPNLPQVPALPILAVIWVMIVNYYFVSRESGSEMFEDWDPRLRYVPLTAYESPAAVLYKDGGQ